MSSLGLVFHQTSSPSLESVSIILFGLASGNSRSKLSLSERQQRLKITDASLAAIASVKIGIYNAFVIQHFRTLYFVHSVLSFLGHITRLFFTAFNRYLGRHDLIRLQVTDVLKNVGLWETCSRHVHGSFTKSQKILGFQLLFALEVY